MSNQYKGEAKLRAYLIEKIVVCLYRRVCFDKNSVPLADQFGGSHKNQLQGPLFLIWFNFNRNMDN